GRRQLRLVRDQRQFVLCDPRSGAGCHRALGIEAVIQYTARMKMHNPARGSSSATHRSNGADRLDRRSRSKGVGRVYQQTVIDTHAKVAFAKLYDRKTPITAAEIPCRHKSYLGAAIAGHSLSNSPCASSSNLAFSR